MLAKKLLEAIDNIIASDQPGQRLNGDSETVCFYCGGVLKKIDVDHVTPRKLGGVDHSFNMVLSCPSCNRRKNAKHPTYFLMQSLGDLPDEQMIEYLARVLYHDLVTQGVK